jgi:hypothetical protein
VTFEVECECAPPVHALEPVRTDQRRGGRLGNQNRLVHGKRSAAAVERRKATMALTRRVREAIAAAKRVE